MSRQCLTFLFCPDLLPWEKEGLSALVGALETLFETRTVEMEELRPLRSIEGRGPFWLFAHRWERALNSLKFPPGTRVHVSVLSHPSTPSLWPALLWRRLRPLSPSIQLVAHSPLCFRFLCEIGRLPQDRVRYLPLPIPPSPLKQGGRKEVVVGTLARFSADSNLNYLLSVAHYVVHRGQGARFRLLGSGPLEGHLRAIIRELGLSGSVEIAEGDVASLQDLDIFLYSPLQNTHFIPILLAGGAQLPVISTEIPGIEQFILDGKDGFLVPVNETKPMAELVLRLVGDESFRRGLGDRLRSRLMESYSPENIATAYAMTLGISTSKRWVANAA